MNTRRQFLVSSIAASAGLAIRAESDQKPLLRIGAITDDHFYKGRPETYRRTKACFALFRKLNADIVVDTGDIADKSDVSDLKLYRQFFDEAFAGTKCVPFFCIANHDYNYVPGTKKNDPKNIENAWKALGMSGPNPTAEVNGYQFVNVFQNEPKKDALAEAVKKAAEKNVGNRPIFVVNHVPPMLTTTGTIHWSSQAVRDALNPYPQVVALTGHIHTAINWAANVWQGEFTAVNLGAHAEYSNKIAGEATVLDVFADRIDIRRYEAVTGREIGADDRWSIPLPLDPKNGPYRTETRKREVKVPAFAESATLAYSQSKDGVSGKLSFSSTASRAYMYNVALESQAEDGKWNYLGTLRWQAPQVMDAPKTWECPVETHMLDAGRPHRATIVPENSLEVAGPAKTFAFDVPANPMKPLAEELLKLSRYQKGINGGEGVFTPKADGSFEKGSFLVAAVFSKAFTAELRKHKTAALVFDITSDQPGQPNTFSIGSFAGEGAQVDYGLGARIYTVGGKIATHRYVWTLGKLAKLSPDQEIALVIREGGKSTFKINSIKCFVI